MLKIILIFLLSGSFLSCKPRKVEGNEQTNTDLASRGKSPLEPFPHADPRDSIIDKLEFRNNSVNGIYSYEIEPKLSKDSINPNLYCYDVCSGRTCQPQKCTSRLTIILEGLDAGVYQIKVRPCFYAELTNNKGKSHKSKTPEGKVIYWYHESTTTITILGTPLLKELAEIDERIDAESAKFLDLLEASDDPNDASLGSMLSENLRSLDSQTVADLFRANFLATLDTLVTQLRAKEQSQPGTSGQSGQHQDSAVSGQASETSGIGGDDIAQTGHSQDAEGPGGNPGAEDPPPTDTENNDNNGGGNNNSNNSEPSPGGLSNQNRSALDAGAIAGIATGTIVTFAALATGLVYFGKPRLSRYWQAKINTTRVAPTTAPLLIGDERATAFTELEEKVIEREKRRLTNIDPGNRNIAEAAIRDTFPDRIANAILGGPTPPAVAPLVEGVKIAATEAMADAPSPAQASAAAASAADVAANANTNKPNAVTNASAPTDARTLYEILGLEKDATAADIKKKYRKLSKDFHPDNPSVRADPVELKKVTEAHAILLEEIDSIKAERNNGITKYTVSLPALAEQNAFARDLSKYQSPVTELIGERKAPAWLSPPEPNSSRQVQYRDWLAQAVEARASAEAARIDVANSVAQGKDGPALATMLEAIETTERNLIASHAFAEAKLNLGGVQNADVWLRAGNDALRKTVEVQLEATKKMPTSWPAKNAKINALSAILVEANAADKALAAAEIAAKKNLSSSLLQTLSRMQPGDPDRAAIEDRLKKANIDLGESIARNKAGKGKGIYSKITGPRAAIAATVVVTIFGGAITAGVLAPKLALAGAQSQAIAATLKEIIRLLQLREAKIIQIANLK